MSKPIKEILSDGEFVYYNWDYGDLEDYAEDCIVWVPKSDYQRLLDANKKLREALEIICDSNHGKNCDLIADKVAKLALAEASKIEGGL